jgi:dephospho-CoA kinase
MKVIGLTGGIGCGKSTVSSILQRLGVAIIDCDEIAKSVVLPGRWGYRRVVKQFGIDILNSDKTINREALAQLVFKYPLFRRQLNSATHLPVLVSILKQLFSNWLLCKPYVIIDMPLLFETGFSKVTHPNIVVTCSQTTQLARIAQRDAMPLEDAKARIASQMPSDRKISLADIVLNNDGTVEELYYQVNSIVTDVFRKRGWIHRWFLSPIGVVALGLVGVLTASKCFVS